MNPRNVLCLAAAFLLSGLTAASLSDSNNSDQESSSGNYSPSARWQVVDTTVGADYLTDNERQVIIEINIVRADPAAYARVYLQPVKKYYMGKRLGYPKETAIRTSEGLSALDECISRLSAAKPVGLLKPKKGLTFAARDHVKDQAKTGGTGHTGSDHSTPEDRINRYGKWNLSVGENIDYGSAQARRIVTSLLIDDGVPSRGHRKNLLDPSFSFIGVAVGPHPVYRKMCVIDLAGAYD